MPCTLHLMFPIHQVYASGSTWGKMSNSEVQQDGGITWCPVTSHVTLKKKLLRNQIPSKFLLKTMPSDCYIFLLHELNGLGAGSSLQQLSGPARKKKHRGFNTPHGYAIHPGHLLKLCRWVGVLPNLGAGSRSTRQ